MDRQNATVRKGRLGETDEAWEARLREAVSPDDRFAEAWLLSKEIWLLIGVPPRRIDIMTGITGVVFAEAWDGRVEASYSGVRVPVIGRDALLKNKRALGRPKALLDIELLSRNTK